MFDLRRVNARDTRYGHTPPRIKGLDVRRIQQALNRRMEVTRPPMARLDEDGDFGNLTRTMVVEFQRLNGQSLMARLGRLRPSCSSHS